MTVGVSFLSAQVDTQNMPVDALASAGAQPETVAVPEKSVDLVQPETSVNEGPKQPEKNQEKQQLDGLLELFGNDLNEMSPDVTYELARYVQRMRAEMREKFLHALPADVQQLIIDVQSAYNNFLEQVAMGNGLYEVAEKVKKMIKKLAKDDSVMAAQLHAFLANIERLQVGLKNGSFDNLLGKDKTTELSRMFGNSLPFIQERLKRDFSSTESVSAHSFTAADLDKILLSIQLLEKNPSFAVVKQNCEAYTLLKTILGAVQQKDIKTITQTYLEYLSPVLTQVKQQLSFVCDELVKREKALKENDSDAQLKEGYHFFFNEVSGYKGTVTVFASLKNNVTSLVVGTRSIFTMILYCFDIYRNFFNCYKRDENVPFLSKPTFFDGALRSALALWNLSLYKSEESNQLLFSTIQGSQAVSSLPMKYFLMLPREAGVFLWTFFTPRRLHKRTPKSIEEFGKIASAWIYYQVCYVTLFGRESRHLWPASYGNLKYSILHALYEFDDYFFTQLSVYIRMYYKPELVDKLEKYSLGIIKPELLQYLFETCLPLIFIQNDGLAKKIIDCRNSDFFPPSFYDQIWHSFSKDPSSDDANGIMKNKFLIKVMRGELDAVIRQENAQKNSKPNVSDAAQAGGTRDNEKEESEEQKKQQRLDFIKSHDSDYANYLSQEERRFDPDLDQIYLPDFTDHYAKKINLKAYYVECRLIKYFFESIGERVGGIVSNKCSDMIFSLTGKVISFLDKFNIGHEWAGAVEGLLFEVMFILQLLKQAFDPSSSTRPVVLYFLQQLGEVTTSDVQDPLRVNQEILDFMLFMLAQKGFITYIEAVKIEKKFTGNPEEIEQIFAEILAAVKSNAVKVMGGLVGKQIGSFVGRVVMDQGPWYPKVRGWFTGSR